MKVEIVNKSLREFDNASCQLKRGRKPAGKNAKGKKGDKKQASEDVAIGEDGEEGDVADSDTGDMEGLFAQDQEGDCQAMDWEEERWSRLHVEDQELAKVHGVQPDIVGIESYSTDPRVLEALTDQRSRCRAIVTANSTSTTRVLQKNYYSATMVNSTTNTTSTTS